MGLPLTKPTFRVIEFARRFRFPERTDPWMVRGCYAQSSSYMYVGARTAGATRGYGGELHRTRSSALLRVAGFKANVHNHSRTVDALAPRESRGTRWPANGRQ